MASSLNQSLNQSQSNYVWFMSVGNLHFAKKKQVVFIAQWNTKQVQNGMTIISSVHFIFGIETLSSYI